MFSYMFAFKKVRPLDVCEQNVRTSRSSFAKKEKNKGGHRAHFRYVEHSEDYGFLEALATVVKYSSSKSTNSTQLSILSNSCSW